MHPEPARTTGAANGPSFEGRSHTSRVKTLAGSPVHSGKTPLPSVDVATAFERASRLPVACVHRKAVHHGSPPASMLFVSSLELVFDIVDKGPWFLL